MAPHPLHHHYEEHRRRGRDEDRLRVWKACGLAKLPFDGFCTNRAWVAVPLIAGATAGLEPDDMFRGRNDQTRAHDDASPGLPYLPPFSLTAPVTSSVYLDERWPWASELATALTPIRSAFL